MRFRRGLAAIVVAMTTLCAASALVSACSLTTSTDGLSGGAVLPIDATTDPALSDAPTDRASGSDAGDAGDAADTAHPFPQEALTWPGNGHGYALYIVPNGVTWIDARTRAEQAGGHLVTIGSAAENAFVLAMLNGRSEAFNADMTGAWLGGYQDNPTAAQEPAGAWRWVDGTPWSFTAWAAGQPDNSGNTDAFLDMYSPNGTLGWNDDGVGGNGNTFLVSYIVEYE